MPAGKLVFAQLMDWIPHMQFHRLVNRYKGNYKVRRFSCWDQFLCMAFAQLTFRESLRDIEECLRSHPNLLYRLGIRGKVSKSTLADANEARDWRVFADLAHYLIKRARRLYSDDAAELEETVYALDSTTIDLCLTLFPWASFRRTKAAIKLHTVLDLRGVIPTVLYLSPGKWQDVNFLDELPMEPGAFYVMDRGYVDFGRLYRFNENAAYFITRAKSNLRFIRYNSNHVEYETGLRSDQLISLRSRQSRAAYPDRLRRVRYFDPESEKHLVFLTNNFSIPGLTVARLYKSRWQIELFFKWIKQNLRIKAFYGTSANAVRTQIWIAVCVYVLIVMIRKDLRLSQNLSSILQVLSVSTFSELPLDQLLRKTSDQNYTPYDSNQLALFDL